MIMDDDVIVSRKILRVSRVAVESSDSVLVPDAALIADNFYISNPNDAIFLATNQSSSSSTPVHQQGPKRRASNVDAQSSQDSGLALEETYRSPLGSVSFDVIEKEGDVGSYHQSSSADDDLISRADLFRRKDGAAADIHVNRCYIASGDSAFSRTNSAALKRTSESFGVGMLILLDRFRFQAY